MKVRLGIFTLLFMAACVVTALTPNVAIGHGGPLPQLMGDGSDPMPTCYIDRNTGKLHCLQSLKAHQQTADGTPEPICRPQDMNHGKCPTQTLQPRLLADGGPIPLCGPNDKECIKKQWPY